MKTFECPVCHKLLETQDDNLKICTCPYCHNQLRIEGNNTNLSNTQVFFIIIKFIVIIIMLIMCINLFISCKEDVESYKHDTHVNYSNGKCIAITEDGDQCKRDPEPNSLYCWQHQ